MDEHDDLSTGAQAPDLEPTPEPVAETPTPAKPRRAGRAWRWIAVLAAVAIVVLLAFAGLAASVRANPQRYLDKLFSSKPATSLSVAGTYMAELSFSSLSTKLENSFTIDYKKPNLLRLEHGTKVKHHLIVTSNGKEILVDAGDGKSVAKAPAPADFAKIKNEPEIKKQIDEMAKTTGIDPSKPQDMAKQIKRCYVGVNRAGDWIPTLKAPSLSLPITAELKNGLAVTMWVDLRTRSPRQVAYDFTGDQMATALAESPMAKEDKTMAKEMADSMKGTRLKLLFTFSTWRQDGSIAPERFTYQVAKSAKVNQAKKWMDLPNALMGLPADGFKPPEEPEAKKLVGQKAPDFTAVTLDGQPVKLSSMRGHPVILDFWATWCPPCRKSMPVLDEVYAAHGGAGLKVVAVSTDFDKADVTKFLAESPVKFRVLWLDQESESAKTVDKAYGITAIPRTLFIDKQGIVRADTTGMHSAEDMKESLAKIGVR